MGAHNSNSNTDSNNLPDNLNQQTVVTRLTHLKHLSLSRLVTRLNLPASAQQVRHNRLLGPIKYSKRALFLFFLLRSLRLAN